MKNNIHSTKREENNPRFVIYSNHCITTSLCAIANKNLDTSSLLRNYMDLIFGRLQSKERFYQSDSIRSRNSENRHLELVEWRFMLLGKTPQTRAYVNVNTSHLHCNTHHTVFWVSLEKKVCCLFPCGQTRLLVLCWLHTLLVFGKKQQEKREKKKTI